MAERMLDEQNLTPEQRAALDQYINSISFMLSMARQMPPGEGANKQIAKALSQISDATSELGGTTNRLESLKRDLEVPERYRDTGGVSPELGIGLTGQYATSDVVGRPSVRQGTDPNIPQMEDEQVVDLLGPTFDKDQYLSLTGQYQHRVQRELESVDPRTGRPAFGTPALRQIESGMLAGMPDQYTRWVLSRTGTPFGKYLDEAGLSRPKDTPLPEYWREVANLGRTYKDLGVLDQGEFMATARQMRLFGVMTSDGSGFTNTLSKEQKWAARSAMGGATSGYLGQINNDRFTALLNAWDTLQVYYPGKHSTPEFLPWVISMLSPGDPGYIEGFVFDPLSGMKPEDKNLGKKINSDTKKIIEKKENPIDPVIGASPGAEAEKRFDAYKEETLGDVDGLMPPTGLKKQPIPEDKSFVDIGVAGDDPDIVGLQQTITPTASPTTTPATVAAFDQYVDPTFGEEGRTPVPAMVTPASTRVLRDKSFADIGVTPGEDEEIVGLQQISPAPVFDQYVDPTFGVERKQPFYVPPTTPMDMELGDLGRNLPFDTSGVDYLNQRRFAQGTFSPPTPQDESIIGTQETLYPTSRYTGRVLTPSQADLAKRSIYGRDAPIATTQTVTGPEAAYPVMGNIGFRTSDVPADAFDDQGRRIGPIRQEQSFRRMPFVPQDQTMIDREQALMTDAGPRQYSQAYLDRRDAINRLLGGDTSASAGLGPIAGQELWNWARTGSPTTPESSVYDPSQESKWDAFASYIPFYSAAKTSLDFSSWLRENYPDTYFARGDMYRKDPREDLPPFYRQTDRLGQDSRLNISPSSWDKMRFAQPPEFLINQ